jgi:hypothetical protein
MSGTCRVKWRSLEPGDGAVLQIIYAGGARQDPKLVGAVEGQRDGIVVEQYNLNYRRTAIDDFVPMSRLRPILGLLVIAFLLFFFALRTQAKTPAAKALAEAKKEAAKHLAELQKKTVPASPLFLLLLSFAGVCFAIAAVLLISSARVGPPFGW